ncbi:SCO4225 family membrane protein [Streptomyces sp. JNUCC 64]
MPHTLRPRRLPRTRALLALATDNWPARGYLAVVAVSFAGSLLDPTGVHAMLPFVLTAPLSAMGGFLPFGLVAGGGLVGQAASAALGAGWFLLSALVNAAVVGALAHQLRGRRGLRTA